MYLWSSRGIDGVFVQVGLVVVNPLRTAVLFRGQTIQIVSNLSPKRDCGPKRVKMSCFLRQVISEIPHRARSRNFPVIFSCDFLCPLTHNSFERLVSLVDLGSFLFPACVESMLIGARVNEKIQHNII